MGNSFYAAHGGSGNGVAKATNLRERRRAGWPAILATLLCLAGCGSLDNTVVTQGPSSAGGGGSGGGSGGGGGGASDGPFDTPVTRFFGVNGNVNGIAQDADAWYLVGSFTVAKAAVAGRYLELSADGTVPNTCAIQSRFNGVVYAIAYDATSIYVGGTFTTYAGQPANRIAKLSRANCALDLTFSPPAPAANGFDQDVYALAVEGGIVYAGGYFSAYRGIPASAYYFARLDSTTGALDSSWGAAGFGNNGFSGQVRTIVLDGGNLYVGGNFSAYKGANAGRIAKISSAGVLDTTFNPSSGGNGFTGLEVSTLVVDNGSIYVGGLFTAYRGVANNAQNLAKIDTTTGVLDPLFGAAGPTSNGFDAQVYSLAIEGGNLYAGGNFTTYQGAANSANKIAKIRLSDGVLDATFYPPGPAATNGFNFRVYALATTSTALYAAGEYTLYRGQAANRIIKLDLATGNPDSTFRNTGDALTGFADSYVQTLVRDGTSLFAGGGFSSYGGVVANRFAKIRKSDGLVDVTVSPQGGSPNGFNAVAWSIRKTGTTLAIGGEFTSYRGAGAFYSLFLNSNTGAVTSP